MRYVLAILSLAILIACTLGGIFASTGLCVFIWGPSVVESALGQPPNLMHPAFWLFLVIMVPAMLIGAAGALFGIIFPLLARYDIAGWTPPGTQGGKLFWSYSRMMGHIARKLARRQANQPLQWTGSGVTPHRPEGPPAGPGH